MFGATNAAPATRLNEAQRRRVRSTFARVDELIETALRGLAATPERSPPFSREVPDATPLQRKLSEDFAARARELMVQALAQLGVEPPAREVSAVWAARVALRSAQVAAGELGPQDLRGYGTLGEDAARELRAAIGPLLGMLEQMESFLAQGAGAELEARLRRLDEATDEVRLLTETGRIIRSHGLVEFRGALEALLERVEARDLEVALFGRVNAGKSSLINAILGEDALPVGPTPVTAVPVRIVHGLRREGRVWFADAAPQIFALGRLAEFASNSQNDSNVRHVTRLELRLPAAVLRQGVTLVDSPGFGALAAADKETALAHLPRCDIGIVAIDAAASPSPEDAAVVDGLLRAGAYVTVVLTKADLLSDDDALNALIHARRRLAAATGSELPVHLISVKEPAAEYLRRWRQAEFNAAIETGLARRQGALRRKVAALAEDVAAALERGIGGGVAAHDTERWAGAESALQDALRELDRARASRAPLIPDPAALAERALAEAAYNAAVLLTRDSRLPNDLTPVIVASVKGSERAAAEAAAREVGRLRALLANALAQAGAAARRAEPGDEELTRPTDLPALDAVESVPALVIERKPLLIGFRPLLERALRARLRRAGAAHQIAAALTRFDARLREWRVSRLEQLRGEFVAHAERLRGYIARRGGGAGAATTQDLEALRALIGGTRRDARPG